ncbi:MAG: FliH/SctL family protein [Sedimentisphaerales bacterium]
MSGQTTVLCSDKVDEVCVLDDYSREDMLKSQSDREAERISRKIERDKQDIAENSRLIKSIVEGMQKSASEIVRQNKEQVVELAVKIAEKIIAANVKEGNYNLASIITETLNYSPQGNDIVVLLNNEDLQRVSALQQQGDLWEFPGVQFKADPCLKKAECKVETPKGTVNYIIKEHLERINKALSAEVNSEK